MGMKPLDAKELLALADLLEADDLIRADGIPLSRDDIFSVLEALWLRGVDLRAAFKDKDRF